jgi:hypothetical protein
VVLPFAVNVSKEKLGAKLPELTPENRKLVVSDLFGCVVPLLGAPETTCDWTLAFI